MGPEFLTVCSRCTYCHTVDYRKPTARPCTFQWPCPLGLPIFILVRITHLSQLAIGRWTSPGLLTAPNLWNTACKTAVKFPLSAALAGTLHQLPRSWRHPYSCRRRPASSAAARCHAGDLHAGVGPFHSLARGQLGSAHLVAKGLARAESFGCWCFLPGTAPAQLAIVEGVGGCRAAWARGQLRSGASAGDSTTTKEGGPMHAL